MTSPTFIATHTKDAHFERGLRSFYEYRDLGIKTATHGRGDAHVTRAAAGKDFRVSRICITPPSSLSIF
jgi:hypothetical protein